MSATKNKGLGFDPRASIVFAGPVRDACGNDVKEIFEDEATWRLVAETIEIADEDDTPSILLDARTKRSPSATVATRKVLVPMYEITQWVRAAKRACVFCVPVEQVRCVRMPKMPVGVKDDAGRSRVEFVDPDEYLRIRAQAELDAKIEKGEATEQ
jgi:hypothetical protein